jgi:phage terminase large subunit GpA-like protein
MDDRTEETLDDELSAAAVSAHKCYAEAFNSGLQPDPDLSVGEWANQHRILSGKASAEPGPYRIERTPYLKEIADCLSPGSPVQRIVFIKSAQVGASELGFNWIGYIMHASPGPVMMVQPTIELAEKVSKQRIAPMIEETRVLSELISAKSRDSGNTVLLKEFRGGILAMTGANSGVGLRSMPVRFLFLDEVDGYPHDIDDEGSPISLAEKRTQTFGVRKKIFMPSTPTVKDASVIESEYLASDQRRYFVPCAHCGVMDWLKWKQIRWDDKDPATTRYVCEHCGGEMREHHKTEMLRQGEWRATAPGSLTAGFHISALYSPVGWTSWSDIVAEFLKAQGDPPALKTFTNTILGETWEEEYSNRLGPDDLMSRAEPLEVMPENAWVATAGIDVQDNRLAIKIDCWGRDEESWVALYQEISGDPAKPEVWAQLENLLLQPIPRKNGDLRISAAAIDSGGHHTHEVYQFTRRHRAKNWIAVKGSSQRNKPAISKPTKVDMNFKGKSVRRGAEVYMVGTDTIKSVIYSRIKFNQPGPGYIHFGLELTPEFFEQLTSERQVTRYVKGFPIKDWKKKDNQRNEALDCAVYSYAAFQLHMSKYNRKTYWDQMEKLASKLAQTSPNNDQAGQIKPEKPRITPKRTNFVNNW